MRTEFIFFAPFDLTGGLLSGLVRILLLEVSVFAFNHLVFAILVSKMNSSPYLVTSSLVFNNFLIFSSFTGALKCARCSVNGSSSKFFEATDSIGILDFSRLFDISRFLELSGTPERSLSFVFRKLII